MQLQDQVCSLELAKQLKELGVRQDSLFYWVERQTDKKILCLANYTIGLENSTGNRMSRVCSAFTVAELGEMLPQSIWVEKSNYYFLIQRTADKGWHISYYNFDKRLMYCFQTDNTEADARAKMLVYLIENKLFTF
jgi:hypothetical protein